MAELPGLGGFTDEDVQRTIARSLKLLAGLAVVGALFAGWKAGWASGLLLLVGAAITGTGLWEWGRVMAAVVARMDAGGEARPMGPVMVGFFVRIGATLLVLYVSLKYLHGSVFALAAGLGLGVFCLTVEALRLLKTWTL